MNEGLTGKEIQAYLNFLTKANVQQLEYMQQTLNSALRSRRKDE